MEKEEESLKRALEGDIKAFQNLFITFQDQLKSYLFRLMANRADAEDLAHDTFIRAFDKLSTFKGHSSLKTWVFQIATNLAYTVLKKRKRWVPDVAQRSKDLVINSPKLQETIERVANTSPYGTYDIKEHIDTCFTCIAKNLPIENQIVLILKDIYDFSVKEIMIILDKTEGVVKYLLQSARKTMSTIFNKKCALINKNGTCHQCSELNGWFNPKQNQQEVLMKIKMVRQAAQKDQSTLLEMRAQLVKAINPLKSDGHALQEILMDCNRMAMGETTIEN